MPGGKGLATTARALGIFKQVAKPKAPSEIVRLAHDCLSTLLANQGNVPPKVLDDLERYLDEMMLKFYGDTEHHPTKEDITPLTQEILKGDFFMLLVKAVPYLKESSRQPAVQIVAGVQSHARQAAGDYLKKHSDILDLMLKGYEDKDVALFYGSMLRDCVRHQEAAQHVLHSPGFVSIFRYIENPQFEVSSDAATTLKELLLRHKATAAEFLAKNEHLFFTEYNKLLQSSAYITKRNAAKLLADMLQDRAYSAVLDRYVAETSNLMPVMNMLRDPSKNIQLDGFHIFKIIARHPGKSEEILHILARNKDKLGRVISDIKLERGTENEQAQFKKEQQELLTVIQQL